MSLIGRLLRNTLVYSVANGLQRFTGFLLIPLYTRVLSVESYGVMEVLAALTSSMLVLALLGLPSAFNKCYYRDCEREEDKKSLLGTAIILIMPATLLTAGLAMALAGPVARLLLGDRTQSDLVALSMISAAAYSLSQIPMMLLRVRESSVAYSALSFGQFLLMMALNLWMVGHLKMQIEGILLSSILSSAAVFLVCVPFVLRHASFRFSPPLARALLRFGIPMIPVSLCAWVMNLSDRWMLNFLANRHEVGLYGLGYRFGLLIDVVLVTPFQLAWPAFYFREAARSDARDLFARVLTWYVRAGGWITLAIALGGEIAVRLMAERDYWPGASVIPVIALAYFLIGCQYCVAPGIHLGGKTHWTPGLSVLGAGLNLALTYLWIPRWGMMGAAVATLASFAVVCAVTTCISRSAYGFHFEVGELLKAAVVIGGLGIIGLGFQTESIVMMVFFRGAILTAVAAWLVTQCMNELGIAWSGSDSLRQRWTQLMATARRLSIGS